MFPFSLWLFSNCLFFHHSPCPWQRWLLRSWFLCSCGNCMEKEMATHSSILAGIIPWTEEPGRLQPMGSQELDTTKAPEHVAIAEEGERTLICEWILVLLWRECSLSVCPCCLCWLPLLKFLEKSWSGFSWGSLVCQLRRMLRSLPEIWPWTPLWSWPRSWSWDMALSKMTWRSSPASNVNSFVLHPQATWELLATFYAT